MFTDASGDRTASKKAERSSLTLPPAFSWFLACLVFNPEVEVTQSFEMLVNFIGFVVNFYRSAWHYILDDSILYFSVSFYLMSHQHFFWQQIFPPRKVIDLGARLL
jgi:hypothetical protein